MNDDFCPMCMNEGRDNCDEHADLYPDRNDYRDDDDWHDLWERDK